MRYLVRLYQRFDFYEKQTNRVYINEIAYLDETLIE